MASESQTSEMLVHVSMHDFFQSSRAFDFFCITQMAGLIGAFVGAFVVGDVVGDSVGDVVGLSVVVGDVVGDIVGFGVGDTVGDAVLGHQVSNFFLHFSGEFFFLPLRHVLFLFFFLATFAAGMLIVISTSYTTLRRRRVWDAALVMTAFTYIF
jgi:hypothetical protein